MIKYTRLNSNNILFELTSKRLNKKTQLSTKKVAFMIRIIQKIKFLKSRLNFFDLAIFFTLLIVLIFFTYNRLQRKSTWINIRVSVENTDWWYRGSPPAYWYVNDLKVGDFIKDSLGNPIVEVINIDNYDLGAYYRDIYVDLKVKVDFDKNKNQYFYEFKPLVVGSSLTLNFDKEQLKGLVVKVDEQEMEYFYKTIRVEKKIVHPSLANQIVAGLKSYDVKGDLVAEILEIKNRVATSYEFSDIRGQNILVNDPDYRDLELVLRVKCFKDLDREFYINKTVIKIGSMIWIQFADFALEDARIIEVMDNSSISF